MAIIECPHCKELMNEIDGICPSCGADVSDYLSKENTSKKPSERKFLLGLPIGKWVAGLVFVIAIILIFVCIYICILHNRNKDDKLLDKLPMDAINSVTHTEEASAEPTVIEDNEIGTVTATSVKGYNQFVSKNYGFTCLVPENFSIIESEDAVFVCESLDETGDYSIPYVMIGKETEFSDPVEFLKDRYEVYSDAYKSQGFSLVDGKIYTYTQDTVQVYEFAFTYTTDQGYEILDTRRAISVGGTIYSISSKELADKSLAISDEEIVNIIESFK